RLPVWAPYACLQGAISVSDPFPSEICRPVIVRAALRGCRMNWALNSQPVSGSCSTPVPDLRWRLDDKLAPEQLLSRAQSE
ncbi:hypothetical protein CRM22_009829, partial [Opisthorchis felineus]